MEDNKKNYLFRLGPLLFLPKDEEKKTPAYKDGWDQYRNLMRLAIIVFYGMICYYLLRTNDVGSMFTESRPNSHYIVFIVPFFISLIDVYLIWLEKKTKIPMNKVSHYFIYGAWIVSAFFYSIYIYKGLLN
jgi:hypothetical protein